MSNPTEAWSLRPGGLARQLRKLREDAGLTGSALAAKVGWTQPKVSKIDNGRQLPTNEEVRAYALAVGADEATLQELLELRSQANAISREWRQGRAEGQAAFQRTYDEHVRSASVIRNVEITTIPGLLQTREYARYQRMQAVKLLDFDADEVEAALEAAMRRQDVLYDATKRFEFVITEAALRMPYCPPPVMLAQLDRLLALTFPRDNLWFGVIPLDTVLEFVPQNRFLIIDDTVLVEHFAGEEEYRAERAETYAKTMDLLMAESVTGEAARHLIVDAMRSLDGQ
jgi:transcriptional regulator with XRE-family HTH domain